MSTPNNAPAAEAGLPRNAVRLAERATAGGWRVTTEPTDDSVSVSLNARIFSGRGSHVVEVFCLWQADKAGAMRWRYASLRKDGRPIADPFGWSQVGHLLAQFAPGMVDPVTEEADLTRHGRGTAHWQADAREQCEAAARETAEVRRVHGRLQEQWAAGAAWAVDALTAVGQQVERAERAADAARVLADGAGTRGAGRAFDLAEDARVLAEVCEKAARRAREVALDAEAEAECGPYVAAHQAAAEAEETGWRARNPQGGPEDFAREVIQAFEVPARDFAQLWAENHQPGRTYVQGWDAFWPDQHPHAETRAYLALEEDTDRAVYALGLAAAARLRAGGDQEQQERARMLEEEGRRGEALYAPGARRRIGEGHQVAVRVWSALVGRGWNAWMSLDVLQDFAVLEEWELAGVVEEARRLRRLLLVDHALRARQARHAALREQLEAERIARHRAGEEVFAAARRAGEDEESAGWARRDFLARSDAEAAGPAPDGRDLFARDDEVWVRPAADEAEAVRYAGRVVAYAGKGRFRVTGPVGLVAREVPADRLAPAAAHEAANDRARQEREDAERREKRAAALAAQQELQAQAQAEQMAAGDRRAARARAASGTMAPVAEGGQWQPSHAIPRSVGELWAAAARNGWRMTCRTGTDGRMLIVRIDGTTGRGRWVFELIWMSSGGQYAVKKDHSRARWADGRSGPRGGRSKPTITDVLVVMAEETREGAEAALGELIGGPGRPEEAPAARA